MDKITIEELTTKYLLEPSIVDVFVEGTEDAQFYGYHLSKMGKNLHFVDISLINISQDLSRFGLENNNRDRVIFLIDELNRKKVEKNVYGIIDRDILEYTRGFPKNSHVLLTDYSCLEMYFIVEENVLKVQKEFNSFFSERLINAALDSASEFSHILIVEKRSDLSITKIKSDRLHKYYNKANYMFDWSSYFTACLNVSNLIRHSIELEAERLSVQKRLRDIDSRLYVNGHMFFLILSIMAKHHNVQMTCETLCDFFRVSVETPFLEKLGLFHKLKKLSFDIIDE